MNVWVQLSGVGTGRMASALREFAYREDDAMADETKSWPHTKDGVKIVPGMRVWDEGVRQWFTVEQVAVGIVHDPVWREARIGDLTYHVYLTTGGIGRTRWWNFYAKSPKTRARQVAEEVSKAIDAQLGDLRFLFIGSEPCLNDIESVLAKHMPEPKPIDYDDIARACVERVGGGQHWRAMIAAVLRERLKGTP